MAHLFRSSPFLPKLFFLLISSLIFISHTHLIPFFSSPFLNLSFTFFSYLHVLKLCLRLIVPSCLSWTWRQCSFCPKDLPVCLCVSDCQGSGHINRISPFHAQSHPMITDPWGFVCVFVCVWGWGGELLHTQFRGQHCIGGYPARRRCAFLQHMCMHMSAVCVIWFPIWGEGCLLNELLLTVSWGGPLKTTMGSFWCCWHCHIIWDECSGCRKGAKFIIVAVKLMFWQQRKFY